MAADTSCSLPAEPQHRASKDAVLRLSAALKAINSLPPTRQTRFRWREDRVAFWVPCEGC